MSPTSSSRSPSPSTADAAPARPPFPIREAHAHLADFGQSLTLIDLAACPSLAACLETVRSAASAAPPGAWVRLTGARIEAWPERRWPTRAELDAATDTGHTASPCVVMSFDHHTAAANSAAMAAAGLRAGSAPEPQGVVVVDNSGEPTGLLLEGAAYAAWYRAPEPSPAERLNHLRAALRRLAELGFTEVHDLHSQPWLGSTLARMERDGELPLRVWLYPPAAALDEIAPTRGAWESDRVRLAGGKVFSDGTLNARTALSLTPYAAALDEAPPPYPRGRAMVTPEQLDAHYATAARHNLPLAVHAIGDGAVRMTLDAIERAERLGKGAKRMGAQGEGGAHRIEHCELIDEADVSRFAALGVVCSVQPCHLLTDIEALTRALPHRLDRVLPLRELIDAGCRPGDLLWFGSDAPIVRPNPTDSIVAATLRRREGMPEREAIGWDQRLTTEEAWAAFRV